MKKRDLGDSDVLTFDFLLGKVRYTAHFQYWPGVDREWRQELGLSDEDSQPAIEILRFTRLDGTEVDMPDLVRLKVEREILDPRCPSQPLSYSGRVASPPRPLY